MKKLLNSINLLVADYLSGKDKVIMPESELTLFIKQCEDDLSALKYEIRNISVDSHSVSNMIQDEIANVLDFRTDEFEQYIDGCGTCEDIASDLKSKIDKFKTKNHLHENTNK